jgi:glycine oxidase
MAVASENLPITIIGGGLAGCVMAWALRARNREVVLLDRGEEVTASKVAAGIVNPVTGPKLTKTWRLEQLWPAALNFYDSIRKKTGREVFRQMPLIRLFNSPREARQWEKRLGSPGYVECLASVALDPGNDLKAQYGAITLENSGYLDIPEFIALTREMLGAGWRSGQSREVQEEGITLFCEGVSGAANPLFEWVPFKPAKGEILTLAIPGLDQQRIVNCGGAWLLPVGGGQFRCGATYDWGCSEPKPTAEGRGVIEERLGRFLKLPYEVIDHQAGIRPVVRESRLLCGMHPSQSRVGFFNGLGSKGVLNAPFFAGNFADYLCGGGPIDPEVDLCGNI